MLTKRCTLCCQKQLKSGKDIGFPGWANSSSLVCSLDFPQVEAVRFGTDPRRGNSRRETAILRNHWQTCPIPLCQRPELLFAISCPLVPSSPSYPFNATLPVLLFHCRRQTLGQGLICDLSISFGSCQLPCRGWDAVGVFFQGQRIPSCSPPLQPSPTGWDVWSCLSSHLVDQNKLKEFSVFSLLMPSNVYFFLPVIL